MKGESVGHCAADRAMMTTRKGRPDGRRPETWFANIWEVFPGAPLVLVGDGEGRTQAEAVRNAVEDARVQKEGIDV